jgi:transposase InsO family protein
VLDALEMANGLRRPDAGLIAHSDRGSQYTSIRYTDRLDELGGARSVGSRGDAYDNAMAEAWVATFKSELLDGRRFPPSSTPSTRSSTGSASITARDCTKHSATCRRPSTR